MLILNDPQKNYGRVEVSDVCPTILATDYKSPKWVLELDEETRLKQIPLPLDVKNVFYTVTTRAGNFGVTNAIWGGHFPLNGVLDLYE